MYDKEFEAKENKFKPRIKLNHNIYIHSCFNLDFHKGLFESYNHS